MLNKVKWCPDHGRMEVLSGEIDISNPMKWQEILEESGIPNEHIMCSLCGSERLMYDCSEGVSEARVNEIKER